ncbi:MAG: DUF1566 domain-containing protein [candidate division Zixibacteria bacterium]|nr:DUF1566 domain-containing protein [candidate division Zixibacteria bacterium]
MRKNAGSLYLAALLIIGCVVFLGGNPAFAGTVDLPRTGQTTCYDAAGNVIPCEGTGEDGEIQAGVTWPEPRFTDNGDGTVTDNLTGLMWLKDGECFGIKTWQDALDMVADFNTNPGDYSYGGGYTATYDDWVLPNVNELESIVNAEEPNPAAWLNGQGFLNVRWDHYWSSTTGENDSDYAWAVSLHSGLVTNRNKSGYYSVWAVRATTTPPAQIWQTGQTTSYATGDDGDLQRGVAWPAPRFKENGDDTVTDNLTGLMWLKDANCFGFMNWQKWQEALDKVVDFNANPGSYTCEGYTGTYNDWRLPNRKERHSFTDFSRYNPALPAGHPFLNVQRHYYWSSTTYANSTGYSWIVYMGSGYVGNYNKSYDGYVWPVRAGQTISNKEPTANAGPNLTISIKEQDLTIVQGTATDPDNDLLTYRWLEEGTELFTWEEVGLNGEAYLDLSLVPNFSIGEHTLTLEVSDGQVTSLDEMLLTVSPLPVCSSTVVTISDLKIEVENLETSSMTIKVLSRNLDNVQQALDKGNNKTARSQMGDFISKVVNRSNFKEGNPNRIALDEANSLLCGAANVLIGIELP